MTDSSLIPFNYDGQEVRVVEINGEPWFVGTDVARVLGYVNPSDALGRLDPDERSVATLALSEGSRVVTRERPIINESGVYALVFASSLPDARAFRRWVTSEVLPTIRRTGTYAPAPVFQLPQTYSEALRALAREVEAREAMETYAKELEPKAGAYDQYLSGDGTYAIGTVAKMLGLSQNKLFGDLRNAGVLIAKGAMANTPYQKYMHHFAVKAYDYTRTDGTVGTSYTTRVQPSGVDFVARKLGRPVVAEAVS